MEEFKIGDFALIISKPGTKPLLPWAVGKVGTVCYITGEEKDWFGIDFGEPIKLGHSCGGNCKDGHGYNFPIVSLEKMIPVKEMINKNQPK